MATKQRNYRIDETLAEKFSDFCRHSGYIQERFIEALFLHAMTGMSDEETGLAMGKVRRWKQDLSREVSAAASQQAAEELDDAAKAAKRASAPPARKKRGSA